MICLLYIPYLFEVNKSFVLLKLPFCQKNEIKSKYFFGKNYIILQMIILILESAGKQEKYKRCFVWRIKSFTQSVKLTTGFVNVEKIMLAKQKETPKKMAITW